MCASSRRKDNSKTIDRRSFVLCRSVPFAFHSGSASCSPANSNMSWERTCCMSTTSSSMDSGASSLPRDYDAPPPPSSSSASFFFLSSSDYIDDQATREQEENSSLPPPPPLHNYHSHLYSPISSTRANVSETCVCQSTHQSSTQVPAFDLATSFQSPFFYEQYLTSFKSEQSEHLPYLFDNIVYPQPCSPPSPTNDSITYYQLDHANTSTIINKLPSRSHLTTVQPIIYQQISLTEPPSSNSQQKLPIVKRFYYDSTMANTTSTTVTTSTPVPAATGNDHHSSPFARLDSPYFGTYDVWHEKTIVGRKNNRREVDVNMGATSVVSRVHFELLLINQTEFHLKCLSKNGIFINNNYTKMSATSLLPKQCTLRFPSTDLCISFCSLLNQNDPIHRSSTDSLQQRRSSSSSCPSSTAPMSSQQQVILVAVNQQTSNHLPALSIQIPNSSTSSSGSSLSAGSSTEPLKSQEDSPSGAMAASVHHGSSCSPSPKQEPNENPLVHRHSSTSAESMNQDQEAKNSSKPPFSYAQLIVQAILSAPDKQMTLSQIYNFISAQYPYYEANNRGWQNSIRHNLSLNRYFIRLARKENESGKGSYWRLDQTCEEKLIDHAFRHRKQRNSLPPISSASMVTPKNEPEDFLLADLHNSNPPTPSSPMTSPAASGTSPGRQMDEQKRKRENEDIEDLLHSLVQRIAEESPLKRPKN